jgi:drug/metabolite transporter (DMT)-like permease
MPHELIIAILAGLGGMIGWGLADFWAKKTIDVMGDYATLAWGHIFGTIILGLLALYQFVINGKALVIPSSLNVWTLLIVFGIWQAVVYLLLYRGFGKGQLAVLNPIFASFAGLTALMSILIFKETVGIYFSFSLLVLFIGIIMISADFGALKARNFSFSHVPGIREVSIATILAAFYTLFWSKFVEGQDWLSYAFFMYLFMTIAILVFVRSKNISLSIPRSPLWKYLILIGAGETLAYASISLGYSATTFVSIIALLSGSFSLPTIILSHIFLKEKVTKLQVGGSIVIIIGIILISIL